jgi:hypothetical protein
VVGELKSNAEVVTALRGEITAVNTTVANTNTVLSKLATEFAEYRQAQIKSPPSQLRIEHGAGAGAGAGAGPSPGSPSTDQSLAANQSPASPYVPPGSQYPPRPPPAGQQAAQYSQYLQPGLYPPQSAALALQYSQQATYPPLTGPQVPQYPPPGINQYPQYPQYPRAPEYGAQTSQSTPPVINQTSQYPQYPPQSTPPGPIDPRYAPQIPVPQVTQYPPHYTSPYYNMPPYTAPQTPPRGISWQELREYDDGRRGRPRMWEGRKGKHSLSPRKGSRPSGMGVRTRDSDS